MIARIKNAQLASKEDTSMASSKLKAEIAKVLHAEGYIDGYSKSEGEKPTLTLKLKYYKGEPVIKMIKRISRPGLRSFKGKGSLPRVSNGLGTALISTSSGVMTDRQARLVGVGGEVLCTVF
jgi:small subunit ribosomal protein S8